MKKIILVNGPPRSGKDTVGRILVDLCGAHPVKFARRLKEAAHQLYDMPSEAHDAFESRKDEACIEFRGKTPRAVYIALSETYFKPLHGEHVFGEMLLQHIIQRHNCGAFADDDPIVVTDSGFMPEAEVLVRNFGPERCLLIRLQREGCNFSGDSRGYIEFSDGGMLDVDTLDVANDGTIEGLATTLLLVKSL